MSLELDWLEREERYRQRVTRLMTVAVILVALLLGTGFYLRSRHIKAAREAASRAAAAQKLEVARRQREQFTADSTATAERYTGFKETFHAEPLEGLPLLAVPLPPGQPIQSFVARVWADYVQAVDPNATPDESTRWFRQNYTDVMNDGPLRGRAILLPQLEQKGTQLEIQKSTFPQIARAQVEVGMREALEEAPADTTGMPQSMASGGESTDVPAGGEPATPSDDQGSSTGEPEAAPAPTPAESGNPATAPPAASPSPAPTSPAPAAGESASTPVEPVPPQAAPQETPPAAATPPDTVPNP